VLFNRESVLNLKKGDLFVGGDCDANVLELCSLLGWKEDLLEQNANVKLPQKIEKSEEEN
jgi:hypothetical protein